MSWADRCALERIAKQLAMLGDLLLGIRGSEMAARFRDLSSRVKKSEGDGPRNSGKDNHNCARVVIMSGLHQYPKLHKLVVSAHSDTDKREEKLRTTLLKCAFDTNDSRRSLSSGSIRIPLSMPSQTAKATSTSALVKHMLRLWKPVSISRNDCCDEYIFGVDSNHLVGTV